MSNFKYLAILVLLTYGCSKPKLSINDGSSIFLQELDFSLTLGGSNNDIAEAITATNDGGYAIAGYTASNDGDFNIKSTNDSDFLILKYNANDALEWKKNYGGSNDDRANDIIQTNDGGFAVIGISTSSDGDVSSNQGNSDFWVVKLDLKGNITWQKSFGFSGRDKGISIIQTNDSGFLITGELDVTASGGMGNSRSLKRHAGGDYWAIKLDTNGTKEWSKFFGGTFTETPKGVVQTNEGDFIIAGFSDSDDVDISNNINTYDFWVIKISSTGKLIWEKNFGGTEIDEAHSITKTNDNNFVVIGDTRSSDTNISSNNGGADLWVIKINTKGELLWEKAFGGSNFDVGRSVSLTNDGGFIIAGSSRSSNNGFKNKGQNDGWILKISSEGNQQWQKNIGGDQIDLLHDAVETQSGKIIAVGESSSNNGDLTNNSGFSDLLIIKIK